MIANLMTQKIAEAMKSGDRVRLSTVQMLSSAFNYEKIAKQHELNDDEELVVIKKEAKKRKDAIEAYEKVGAIDRADKERVELKILQEFLPAEVSDEEVTRVVEEAIAQTGAKAMSDMGKVIGLSMSKLGGGADGSRVSAIAKAKLSQNG